MKKILFIVASHGDEPMGLKVVERLFKGKTKNKFDYLIGNPKALKNNARFIDTDLNRIYPGKPKGNIEETVAYNILKFIKKNNYDYIIDLHSTVSKTGTFIIITKPSTKNLGLALMFDIKKIVIWPKSKESTGSLSSFVKCGVEIESGPKNDEKIIKNLENILNKFIEGSNNKDNIKDKIRGKEFYMITGKIKSKKIAPKLKDFKKNGKFYPLFVNQYEGMLCYKMKKINYSKIKQID